MSSPLLSISTKHSELPGLADVHPLSSPHAASRTRNRAPAAEVDVDRVEAARSSSSHARPTAEVPAAIATASDGIIQSGPMAQDVALPRRAVAQLWAAPEATVRIYNASVLENGAPKLIWKGKAPEDPNAGGEPLSQQLGPASPHERMDWQRKVERLKSARVPGQSLVTAELPASADWSVHDHLLVTQQVGSRAESEPQSFGFSYYAPSKSPRVRDPYFVASRVSHNGRQVTGDAYTVPPRSILNVLRDGVPVGSHATADARGAFSIQLPDDWNAATWELGIGTLGGQRIAPLNGSTAAGSGKVVDAWMREFRHGLMQPPRNGTLAFTMDDLPPGLSIRIFNSANGASPRTFTADAAGHLEVKVDGVQSGDRLAMETDPIPQLGHLEIRADKLALTYQVPTRSEAQALARIDKHLAGYSEADIHFALSLFGPFGTAGEQRVPTRNGKTLRAAVDAATLGFSIKELERSWLPELEAHFRASAPPAVAAGFVAGAEYRGDNRPSPRTLEGLRFKRVAEGEKQRVGTRVKPDTTPPPRLANRVIDVETIRSPDVYLFKWPGVPPLELRSGEIKPRGDIDRNIYVLTFNIQAAGSR